MQTGADYAEQVFASNVYLLMLMPWLCCCMLLSYAVANHLTGLCGQLRPSKCSSKWSLLVLLLTQPSRMMKHALSGHVMNFPSDNS